MEKEKKGRKGKGRRDDRKIEGRLLDMGDGRTGPEEGAGKEQESNGIGNVYIYILF